MYLEQGTSLQGGKYKIIRYISSGGFGATYEASHVIFRKNVAIKEFFVKDYCNRDATTNNVVIATQSKCALVEKLRRKFLDEAVALFELRHNNIVRVTDVFEENGTAYYVMDYIDGSSLSAIIASRGALGESEAVGYIRQVADALDYVHSHNRLHLDIKPGNIMIDNAGNAVLIDFGVSKQYDEESGENTSTLIGVTPGYAPLEQVGNNVIDFFPATDIYALGATLYKTLTGVTPVAANLRACGDSLPPLPATVSDATRTAVEAAMRLNRHERLQSIAEFLALLSENAAPKAPRGPKVPNDDTVVTKEPIDPKVPNDPNEETVDIRIDTESSSWEFPKEYHTEDSDNGGDRSESGRILWWLLGVVLSYIIVCFCIFAATDSESNDDISTFVTTDSESNDDISTDQKVDLGLSVYWAGWNVGASSPEDYGNYYAWGETNTKSNYTESSYQYHNGSRYINIGSNISGTQYDVARAQWGGSWRLPTKAEMQDLKDRCTWIWTTYKGVPGYKVTGPNGNSIFLPAAGYRSGAEINLRGGYGYYCSGTRYESNPYFAYRLYFSSSGHGVGYGCREDGHTVRPVSN